MSPLRRIVAALSGALLLQLTLLGSGAACEMRETGGAAKGAVSHDMQGMTGHSSAPASCGAMDMSSGCTVPPASGRCSSMTACAITATPSFAPVVRGATSPAEAPDLDPAAFVSGPTAAPELPPPRA